MEIIRNILAYILLIILVVLVSVIKLLGLIIDWVQHYDKRRK